jgi:predicted metal-binding membrane protein
VSGRNAVHGAAALAWILRRDRMVTLAVLATVVIASWGYVLAMASMDMASMPMGEMIMGTALMPWSPAYFGLMLAMWAVMMVAMMLPSAAPMVLLFTAIERRRSQVEPYRATALFGLGYISVWLGFSLGATVLQWSLERLALLSPMMATTSTALGGVILVAAGLYQLTPLKQACLRHCRSPLDFITQHWRQGPFHIGLWHGLFCLGCCWMLMALLFVGGVMNPLWIAAITLFVLVEKLAPRGNWIGRTAGIGLASWGGWILLTLAA